MAAPCSHHISVTAFEESGRLLDNTERGSASLRQLIKAEQKDCGHGPNMTNQLIVLSWTDCGVFDLNSPPHQFTFSALGCSPDMQQCFSTTSHHNMSVVTRQRRLHV